ncbi:MULTISPECIES: curli assembly protein CsgF [unclassified Devosia]|uniref:curli assembly protein CsgF n=1 Tax=unclassified Devosia TaxID=196773 RepID=UPI0025BE8161|nr:MULTISPECIES: curli assembly protein CsgF [unclassified Devosia]
MLFVGTLLASPAMGSDLVYTPINPTFGGNPLNSSHLLAIASAQRTATASDAPKTDTSSGTGGTGSSTSQSNVDLFISQLEGRLLSSLASQVTDAIFGSNPQNHGTITFGSTIVVFDRSDVTHSIDLTITDTTTGQVTLISVPQLVTSP